MPGEPDFDIRPFEPADLAAVRNLYLEVWGASREERHDRLRFIETFQIPAASVVAMDDSGCAGFVCIWPVPLRAGDRLIAGGQPIDVMTSPRHQGKGIFTRVARRAIRLAAERGIEVLFGTPNPAALPVWRHRLGWAEPCNVTTLVRPLSLFGPMPFGRMGLEMPSLIPRDTTYEIREEPPADDELETFLGELEQSRSWQVHLTPGWCRYRYQSTGTIAYRWVCLYERASLRSFAVIGMPVVPTERVRRATLAEAVATDRRMRRTTIAVAARIASATGHHVLIAKATPAITLDLMRNGFIPVMRAPLITRTLNAETFATNPFRAESWHLSGAAFDSA